MTRAVFVGGGWQEPADPVSIEITDPTTGEVLSESAAGGGRADVERAVEAARSAAADWAALGITTRAAYLEAVAPALRARRGAIADAAVRELGIPVSLSKSHAEVAAQTFEIAARAAVEVEWEERVGASVVRREPVGVVAAVTACTSPVQQIATKASAALAAGCSVVVKPSERAPMAAALTAEAIAEAGLVPGAFNLVTGTAYAGEALVAAEEVDMVSFTGSAATGKRVAALAGAALHRLVLELGGKSASIVLDDAPLERAVAGTAASCFRNSGQTCDALSRLLVPRPALAEAEEIAALAATTLPMGDPRNPETLVGPLVSSERRDSVRGRIASAINDGARLVCGGVEAPEDLQRGWFVCPTVLSDVMPTMDIAREEVLGPVMCVIPYDTEDEAVRIANQVPYGLAGAVWSRSRRHARDVARHLRCGRVDLNGARFDPEAPFGGRGQSGFGRELGRYGIEEFLELKSIHA